MTGPNPNFTVADGIIIQTSQLQRWEKLLKPEVFKRVARAARRNNSKAKNGYEICRGTQIEEIILNLKVN